MLISVLLPTTGDRLEYLRYAVESVRRQDYEDWELVISDNASADGIKEFVEETGDPRIRRLRTDTRIPVTDNWNRALDHSRGEYVVMLGDDDALLPGYLSRIAELALTFDHPDTVYTGALLFAYPGVLPDVPNGFLQPNLHAPFFAGATAPFRLDPSQARGLVAAAMDLRLEYDFNMQYAAVKRSTIDALSTDGAFFHAPFPDYYAMNLLFAEAAQIVVDPAPRVVIGITKRSYGFYHFNRRESEAVELLSSDNVTPDVRDDLDTVVLPGTNINTSWLVSMEMLYRRLGRPADMRPNRERYRRLQAIYCLQAYYVHHTISRREWVQAAVALPRVPRLIAKTAGPMLGVVVRHTSQSLRERLGRIWDRLLVGHNGAAEPPKREIGRYQDMLDVISAPEFSQPVRNPTL